MRDNPAGKPLPYTEEDDTPHRNCGGRHYYEISSDPGDYRMCCDKYGKVWVEVGPGVQE